MHLGKSHRGILGARRGFVCGKPGFREDGRSVCLAGVRLAGVRLASRMVAGKPRVLEQVHRDGGSRRFAVRAADAKLLHALDDGFGESEFY